MTEAQFNFLKSLKSTIQFYTVCSMRQFFNCCFKTVVWQTKQKKKQTTNSAARNSMNWKSVKNKKAALCK